MTALAETVMQQYFAAFARRDPDAMLALMDDDVRGLYPAEPHRDWRGKSAAAATLHNYFGTYPDLAIEWQVERVEPEPGGQRAGVFMCNRMTAVGLDRRVHLKYVVEDGRIKEVHHLA